MARRIPLSRLPGAKIPILRGDSVSSNLFVACARTDFRSLRLKSFTAISSIITFSSSTPSLVNKPEYIEHVFLAALSRSWVLLVNRAGRSQPACRYFNALGHSSPSQIGSEIAYSWPM